MYEQLTLFQPPAPPVHTVYGGGVGQTPALPGRKDSAHLEAIYLDRLLPLENYRTNATAKAHRLVHQWRSVIDWDEARVWEIIKRWCIVPHPCYAAGWNRCSCMMCIFSLPSHWAGIRELFLERFEEVEEDERVLGLTLDNKPR